MAARRKQPAKPKPKRLRTVNENYARFLAGTLTLREAELIRLQENLPPALKKVLNTNQYFSPQHHAKNMALSKKFLASLTPKTRVLEMGAGSGRLTNFMFKNSKLKPENYTMFDLLYDKSPPWFKRKVSGFIKAGKLKLIEGDMFTYRYPKNAFNHILIPEAFFTRDSYAIRAKELGAPARKKIAAGKLSKVQAKKAYVEATSRAYTEELKFLIDRLAPALKKGGSIRLSKRDLNFRAPRTDFIRKHAAEFFPGFKVTVVRGKQGLVFEKK